MFNVLKKQFVKVPNNGITNSNNKTVNIDPQKTMDELFKDPKLVKTLKKLSLV